MGRIAFVRGALEDLSAYPDASFDLVLSLDAPISYTYPNQERVIGELVRIARKRILISVSSRLGYLPYLANPVQKNQFILVQWLVSERENQIRNFRFSKAGPEKLLRNGLMGGAEEIAEYEAGGAPWCITYTFLPDELEGLHRKYGVRDVKLAGPGAYARTIPREILVQIMGGPRSGRSFWTSATPSTPILTCAAKGRTTCWPGENCRADPWPEKGQPTERAPAGLQAGGRKQTRREAFQISRF